VRTEGRRLMAADIAVEGRRPLPKELEALLARQPAATRVERTDVREFVSVVANASGDQTQLAELKVVDGVYPFYGTLELDPSNRKLSELLDANAVVVATELLSKLNAKIGDELRIGGADFRIAGAVLEEPDKLSITFTLGPRVFMSSEGVGRTALLDKGARVEYRALLKMPDGSSAGDVSRLASLIEGELRDAEFYRVRTFSDAQPALRRSFERMGRYLGLVGLLSLLVGGVGVAQVARAWLSSRMDDIAIMRCLGARPREVILLYLGQVLLLALIASVAGAVLATMLHWLVPKLTGGLLPAELIHPWQPHAIMRGICLGVAVAILFTFPLLVGLRKVPPVRVLRRDAEPVRAGWFAQIVGAIFILVGVWAAATSQAESLKLGTWFVAGLVATIVLLALVATAISRVARLIPRQSTGVRLRHGLTHLARPGAATVGAIVAMGLGVTFVFATRVVERHLSDQLSAELPENAPSTFFLDVQPDQWPQLETMLKQHGAVGIDSKPIVTARFSAINGVPVDQLVDRGRDDQADRRDNDRERGGGGGGDRPRPRRWTLTREQRVTYGSELPRGNRVTAGKWPAAPQTPNGVSIEENFARDLRVKVGSKLTLDVQGVPVELMVTSLRTVDWRTFGLNFFLFAEPGPLNDAPQSRVAVARLASSDLPKIQSAVVAAFPNVTVIHVRDVMDKVLAVLNNIGIAVKSLGAFTVIAGIIVLGGTVAATQARRAREVALLKTVGMTRRDVAAVFAIEYALTGAVAAIVGIGAGYLLAWAVLTQLMELPFAMGAMEATVAAIVTIVLAVVAGLIASARALSARPVEVLRSE
jgi:putative ABC transport system permease protein